MLLVDQSPIGRSARSNPVTYLKAFDPIRELFAATKDAKARGLTAQRPVLAKRPQRDHVPSAQGQGWAYTRHRRSLAQPPRHRHGEGALRNAGIGGTRPAPGRHAAGAELPLYPVVAVEGGVRRGTEVLRRDRARLL